MAIDQEFLKSIGLDDEALAEKLIAKSTDDEKGLVNKRDELLGKNTTYKDNLAKFDGLDPDKYREMLKQIETIDEKNMMDKGEFEKIRQKLVDANEDERKVSAQEKEKLRAQLENYMIDSAAAKAISESDGNIKLLMPIIKGRVDIIDNDGTLTVQIKSDSGEPATDKEGKPLTMTGLLEEIKADESYSGAFASSGLSGGGAKPSIKGSAPSDDGKVINGAAKMASARA